MVKIEDKVQEEVEEGNYELEGERCYYRRRK
jgi:hypothetical protein